MKKHIVAIIPALLCACTPSETEIQAACANLKAAKINRPLHEQMFAACVANGSKRAATVADNESEIIKECSEAATKIYPVDEWDFPTIDRGIQHKAYTKPAPATAGSERRLAETTRKLH